MTLLSRLARCYYKVSHLPEYLAPLLDLGLRLYLASIFFKSGLTKVQSWDSTLYLFSDVYDVPLLPPEVAASMAASAELGLSVLLVLGLFGRFAAAGLFILNGVAVISYADLSDAGINQHLSWGILLGVLLVLSRGNWSVDAWLEKRLR
ncbi:MAG: DoxX family membrane protein [Nitrosomonadales bacterium]|jgi:putative oxidoreductase|nr:DoxX family membrane protein [Nitrosomonadales bacterium]MBL0038718.1 DoxX family membrane protein [Nitrosomonadales bacterium]